ncbi:hypothetical protein Tco_0408975 [Tanacetum coccineum]
MSSHKCPKLSKRLSNSIPKTVDEMLKRIDDYVRSEEAFRDTELPKGEFQQKETPEHRPPFRPQEYHAPYIAPHRPHKDFLRKENHRDNRVVLTLYSLVSSPKEILATKHQLCLPQPPPLVGAPTEDQKRKSMMIDENRMNVPIMFPPVLARDLSEEVIMVEAEVEGYLVQRYIWTKERPLRSWEQVNPLGKIELDVCFEGDGLCRREIMKFIVIPSPSPYNIILGCRGLKQLRAIPSTIHGMMKFPTLRGITTLASQTAIVFECRRVRKKQAVESSEESKPQEKISLTKEVLVNLAYPNQLVTVGKNLSPKGSAQLKALLKKNKDIFAWELSNIKGVSRRIIKHAINANTSITPVGIVRPVRYPTWISNPVLVKKADGSWRMYIDFKNINSVCPKDYYPLPEIDLKIESVMRFPFKCFLDAYKGYHQIQMAEEDEQKISFYTDQGMF